MAELPADLGVSLVQEFDKSGAMIMQLPDDIVADT
jgi:hypothetical protein